MSKDNKSVGERAVELLVENGYGPAEDITGCTEDELRSLEERYDVTLPEAYKSCMRHIGRYTGGCFSGTEFTYPEMELQHELAEEVAEEDDLDFEFGENDFVFQGLQGHGFWYFDTEAGEDPPVYDYVESDISGHKNSDSFSEYIYKKIQK